MTIHNDILVYLFLVIAFACVWGIAFVVFEGFLNSIIKIHKKTKYYKHLKDSGRLN